MSYYLYLKDIMKKDKIYQFTYHPTQLNRKPATKTENWIIHNNMIQTGTTIENICKYIGNGYGYTFTPNLYSDNKPSSKTFIGTSGFFLDFDLNSNPEQILNRFYELNIKPNFWYTSFSDTPEYRKFRVCLLVDEIINDSTTISNIFSNIFYHFPADNSCKDFARKFYGGKEVYFLTEEPNHLETLKSESTWAGERAPLQFDSEKPVNLLYTNNEITGISERREKKKYSSNQPQEFTYLEKLRNNDCDFSIIENKIRVFREFFRKEVRFNYLVLIGLARNLYWLQGGMLILKKCMEEYNELKIHDTDTLKYYDRHFEVINQVKKKKLLPQSLESFSPYPEDFKYKNLISCLINPRGVVFVNDPVEKFSLQEGEKMINDSFQRAMTSNALYTIIKAGVGIGKSHILKNIENIAIALPTHKLKDELYEEMNVDAFKIPELPVFESKEVNVQINSLYQSGLRSEVMGLLHQLAEKDSPDQILAKTYLNDLNEAKKWKGTLLTTHERSIHEAMNQNTIIYDEDCIHSLVSQKSFNLTDFGLLLLKYPDLAIFFNECYQELQGAEKSIMYITPTYDLPIQLLIEKLKYEPSTSNFIEFFSSNRFYKEEFKDKKGQVHTTIHYCKFNTLPTNKKIIILSATINHSFYEKAFPGQVEVIEIPEIENMGKVTQYTKYSNSRQSLKKREQDELLDKIGNKPVITFMSNTQTLNQKYIKENGDLGIYFGNTRGYNDLKGKDIKVIGTPHINPIVYLFHAEFIGIDTNKNDQQMDYQTIQHNGMQFKFKAFNNLDLREIQLNLIEGELIQAVGRARTIRTDAQVQVFSNFPLTIADEYIFD
jgi:hypothetical protein